MSFSRARRTTFVALPATNFRTSPGSRKSEGAADRRPSPITNIGPNGSLVSSGLKCMPVTPQRKSQTRTRAGSFVPSLPDPAAAEATR